MLQADNGTKTVSLRSTLLILGSMETLFIYIAELPIWISIPGSLVLALVISLIGTIIPNEIYTYQELAANNDIVNTKFSYFGGIFAVSLGLALVGAYGVYLDARDASTREVGALRSLYYSLPAEGAAGDSPLNMQRRAAVMEYTNAVISEDWTVRGQDKPNFNSDIALKKMFDIFIAKPEESHIMDSHLHWLNDAVEAHSMRASSKSRTLSVMIWSILLFGTALSIFVPMFFGTQSIIIQAILSSTFSAFILLHLLVIIHLAYPVNDDVGISTAVYIEFLEEVKVLNEALGHPRQ